MYRSIVRSAYAKTLQEYIPGINASYFMDEKAVGIRALALDTNGNLVDDFVFDVTGDWKSVLHVRNAPSPAATSSLAIAKEISDLALSKFTLS
jgi:2-hydroxyglutarate dehydrogenase